MASFLGKKPFIDKMLSSCSAEQLATLLNLINNPGEATTVYLFGHEHLLSSANIGVSYVQLMVDEYSRRYLYGFLIYIDNTHCGFFSLRGFSSILTEIEIDPVTLKYTDIYEQLSPEEFRRTLADMVYQEGIEGGVSEAELELALADKVKKVEVEDITNISATILDKLKPGDQVIKITGNQKHAYKVSYKGTGAGTGICLTYADASVVETVSYDKSGSGWVYNSKDSTALGEGGTEVVANPTLAGTETALEGLEIDSIKYKLGGGGTKWYLHTVRYALNSSSSYKTAQRIFSTEPNTFSKANCFNAYFNGYINVDGNVKPVVVEAGFIDGRYAVSRGGPWCGTTQSGNGTLSGYVCFDSSFRTLYFYNPSVDLETGNINMNATSSGYKEYNMIAIDMVTEL